MLIVALCGEGEYLPDDWFYYRWKTSIVSFIGDCRCILLDFHPACQLFQILIFTVQK